MITPRPPAVARQPAPEEMEPLKNEHQRGVANDVALYILKDQRVRQSIVSR